MDEFKEGCEVWWFTQADSIFCKLEDIELKG